MIPNKLLEMAWHRSVSNERVLCPDPVPGVFRAPWVLLLIHSSQKLWEKEGAGGQEGAWELVLYTISPNSPDGRMEPVGGVAAHILSPGHRRQFPKQVAQPRPHTLLPGQPLWAP